MSRLRLGSLVVLAACSIGLAACGSSAPKSAGSAGATSSTTTTSPSSTGPAGGGSSTTIGTIPTADLSPAGRVGTAPTVVVPKGKPPTSLESADLITGTGPAAKDGDSVTVEYVLATYSSGKVIQSSWTSSAFTFTLGAGQVIPGWDEGVVGMKVGGRRELIIPPALGYGDQSPGPGISVNDTLVFVIDLQKIG
jgi:peptidylprolyl isomerase